jgi:predicted Zn-dependent peptidase
VPADSMRSGRGQRIWPLLSFLLCLAPGPACAHLDLAAATVERLDNGLTVMVLDEPAFPLVSVQMLYRVGAKHEPAGVTGLAHFLEHMAFRSSENFPDTGLVSSIYAVGGEWHGYTWLDQTTYFATAPREDLDLLLRIEADRMARLSIPEAAVAAERGAVLAEMHVY